MNINWRKLKSLTLAELLVGVCILLLAVSAILLSYANCFVLFDSVRNVNIATNAAQGVIEDVRNTPFNALTNETMCDCVNFLCNGCTFTVNGMPQNRGVVYVDETAPELLGITVSICWRQKGRLIGEDANLNGVLDTGEDANNNGRIDSAVQLTTKVVKR